MLFAEQDGSRSAAQIKAFGDTWRWDEAAAALYQEVVEVGGKVSDAMQAFRRLLGDNDMMAYLAMMAPRLVELRRVLKPTGSLYLHCDPAASHYLKILLDAAFGPACFRNEIIWKRSHAHSSAKRYGPIHDVILFYGRGDDATWTDYRLPYENEYVDKFFKFDDDDGRGAYWTGDITGNGVRNGPSGLPWRGFDPRTKGRHWMHGPEDMDRLDEERRIFWPKTKGAWPKLKRYLQEAKGVPLQDLWTDIYALQTMGSDKHERLGYPTQKPEALLERIIQASSREGEVVLDPFCGCGTAIAVAQKLGRRWQGIDITHLAINLIKHRLHDTFGLEVRSSYRVVGEPVTLPDATDLAAQDPYQFQFWALGLVGARPAEQKKGADHGIDGRLFFHDERAGGKTKQIIISVKAGHLSVSHLRDLRGVLEREGAQIGVLISLEEATKPMRTEAAGAGFYVSPALPNERTRFSRLQLLTVAELLSGKAIAYPLPTQSSVTFKRAPRQQAEAEELTLPLDTPTAPVRKRPAGGQKA